jgi:hypothetical protein
MGELAIRQDCDESKRSRFRQDFFRRRVIIEWDHDAAEGGYR